MCFIYLVLYSKFFTKLSYNYNRYISFILFIFRPIAHAPLNSAQNVKQKRPKKSSNKPPAQSNKTLTT